MDSPAYDPSVPVDEAFEARMARHYVNNDPHPSA
jgi:hypothetical protein